MNRREPLTPAYLRERAGGITQREVAIIMEKRVATISDWERHVNSPLLYPYEMLRLCRAYKATIEEVVEAFDRIDPNDV